MEFGVEAVAGHELVVGAAFGDDSALDDGDLVGVADGAETMGDGDDGLALHELFEGVDDEFFGFAVERGGGLVEQEDGAVADHDAGDADALALAAGEGRAAIADQGVVAERHGHDEVVGVGELGGRDDLFLRRVGAAEGDVLEDGSAKEDGVLQDVADLVAQMLEFVVADVLAVDVDFAGLHVVEARDEADDGGFSAAGGADDADKLRRA